jgi:SAM-dependent methyltransferase
MDRVNEIIKSLPVHEGKGLEIAPLFKPILKRPKYDIDYTDYMSTEELRERDKSHPGITDLVDIDFVWAPGKRLKDCAEGRMYDYVISSHVWEHVPNPIGWMEQVLEVCRPGAIVSLALPTKHNPIDYIRREVDISEWVGSYIENRSNPSAKQVFDCLYHARKVTKPCNKIAYTPEEFAALPRSYTVAEAMSFANRAHTQNIYTDVHCSVFMPESFPHLMAQLKELELINAELIDVSIGDISHDEAIEFFVKFRKLPDLTAPSMEKPEKQPAQDGPLQFYGRKFLKAFGLYQLVKKIVS